jgi:hypothetical protein
MRIRTMTHTLDLDALLDAFDGSLITEEAIAIHLDGVDREDARTQVLDALSVDEIDDGEAEVLGRTLVLLDPAPVLGAVLDVIADREVADSARLACYQALLTLSPMVVGQAAASNPAWSAGIEFVTVYSTLLASHEQPESLATLHFLVKQVPTSQLATWAEFLESLRERAGLPASTAYAALLSDPALASNDGARSVWLNAIIGDADNDGLALLKKLRAGAAKKLRAPFQVALLKLEAALAEGTGYRASDHVRVWCSQPDGQGAVAALVSFANSDNTSTVVNLCFRLTRDLRQGFVQPRTQERELIAMREHLAEGAVEVLRAPVGEFATIVDEAVASHRRMGVRVPPECEPALRALERLPRAPLPPAPVAVAVNDDRMHEIIDDARHGAWYFDDDDLRLHGALGLQREKALAVLGRSPMCVRVEAMARFMVHWTRWRGDERQAAEWVAIADEVARDFAESALVEAMADASPSLNVAGVAARIGHKPSSYGVSGVLIPFEMLFPQEAGRETKVLRIEGHARIPDGDYRFEESFCTDRRCDCERVTFHVLTDHGVACRIGYAFTKAAAKRFYGEQVELDPTGPVSSWAAAMVRELDTRMAKDKEWRDSVKRHYTMARSL